jgi:hypothetical protein
MKIYTCGTNVKRKTLKLRKGELEAGPRRSHLTIKLWMLLGNIGV